MDPWQARYFILTLEIFMGTPMKNHFFIRKQSGKFQESLLLEPKTSPG